MTGQPIIEQQVFFDLDGTLHQQDLFGSYIRFLLRHFPFNWLLLVLLSPVYGLGFLISGRCARWPMSLFLWALTFGHSEEKITRLEREFVEGFKQKLVSFDEVHQQLNTHLESANTQVWLITGSPESLVEAVYQKVPFLSRVTVIGSRMARRFGGRVLTVRCLGKEKVRQLQQRMGTQLKLTSGYSDSKHDTPMMILCEQQWRVDKKGGLSRLDAMQKALHQDEP